MPIEDLGNVLPLYAPLYPTVWTCEGFRRLSIICETSKEELQNMLQGTPLELVTNRYEVFVDNLLGHSLGGFYESGICIPVRFGDVFGVYHPVVYVTTDRAMAAGREVFGYPKLMADVGYREDGNLVVGTTDRAGVRIIDVSCSIDKNLRLDRESIFPSGRKGEWEWTHHLLVKTFPRADAVGPALKQVVYRNIRAEVSSLEPGTATVVFNPSETDPLYRIAPTKVLGGFFITGDFGAGWGVEERKVLATLDK